MSLAWTLLLLASFTEALWGLSMKQIHLKFSISMIFVIICLSACDITLLSFAMRKIPAGIAYAVWSGLGLIGVAIGGTIFFKEVLTLQQLFFFVVILVGIVGLKLT